MLLLSCLFPFVNETLTHLLLVSVCNGYQGQTFVLLNGSKLISKPSLNTRHPLGVFERPSEPLALFFLMTLYIACLSAALLQLVILMFVFPFEAQVCVVQEDAENAQSILVAGLASAFVLYLHKTPVVFLENFLLFLRKFELNSSGCKKSPTAAVIRTRGSNARQEERGNRVSQAAGDMGRSLDFLLFLYTMAFLVRFHRQSSLKDYLNTVLFVLF